MKNENYMENLTEFAEKLAEYMTAKYGKDYSVSIHSVTKNNGITLTGLTIRKPDYPASPTIYLESYYHLYLQNQEPLDKIAADIIQLCENHQLGNRFEIDFFRDFEKVKSRIVYKVIGKEKNEQLIQDIPHMEFLDMYVVFYYMFEEGVLENASILIRNSHLDLWKKKMEEVFRYAQHNTPLLLPAHIMKMRDVMIELFMEDVMRGAPFFTADKNDFARECASRMVEDIMGNEDNCNMYVMTNNKKQYGAASILYQNKLQEFAEQFKQGIYVFPASVHEVVLVPEEDVMIPGLLQDVVRGINKDVVSEEEVLTDSVYYYDYQRKILVKRF